MSSGRPQTAQPSCSHLQTSTVHARAAQASPQNTRLLRRTARTGSTRHWQLAHAHFIRRGLLPAVVAALFRLVLPPRFIARQYRLVPAASQTPLTPPTHRDRRAGRGRSW